MVKYFNKLNYEYMFIVLLIVIDLAIYFSNTNLYLFYKINAWHVFLPDSIMHFFSYVGSSYNPVLIPALLVVTVIFRIKQIARVLLVIALYYIVVGLLKNYSHVARPYMVLNPTTFYFLKENYNYILDGYHSFPSGHTSLTSIFVLTINKLFFNNKGYIRYFLLLFIPLVAIIKIASGYHYPIDVISAVIFSYFIVKISFIKFPNKDYEIR